MTTDAISEAEAKRGLVVNKELVVCFLSLTKFVQQCLAKNKRKGGGEEDNTNNTDQQQGGSPKRPRTVAEWQHNPTKPHHLPTSERKKINNQTVSILRFVADTIKKKQHKPVSLLPKKKTKEDKREVWDKTQNKETIKQIQSGYKQAELNERMTEPLD